MKQIEETRPPEGQESSTVDRVQEGVQAAGEKARAQVEEQKGKVGETVRDQVDQRSKEVGEQARSIAQALRKTSAELRSDEAAGSQRSSQAVDRTADGLDRLAEYLTDVDARRMLDDVEAFGRRRPWAIALAGATVGLIASRVLKASSQRRYEQSASVSSRPVGTSLTAGPRSGYQPTG
jgi:ElaB/YqjD/DUF883 family membrane-anchored ribosome-binding protein